MLTNEPVKPSGTSHEVVMTGTVESPTMTLVVPVVQVACWVELEQSVMRVVIVVGGIDEDDDGQTKLGTIPLETVITVVVTSLV